MSIKTVPAAFETSDGKKHASQKAAEQHQALLDAHKAFTTAQCAYEHMVAETQRTKDGKPFSFSRWRYWRLYRGYGRPRLEELSFNSWNCRVEGDDGEMVIHDSRYVDGRNVEIRAKFTDIYAEEQNARVALVDAVEEWLGEEREALAELKRKWGLGG